MKVNDETWKGKLTKIQYEVARLGGTERAFSGSLNLEKRKGDYCCVCCNHILFTSDMKYNSGCGWPSFFSEHSEANIKRIKDHTHGMERMEIRCNYCDAHLGHVFNDGPKEHGGERYCVNSASMDFDEQN